jgi:hypothetical protein
MAIAASPALAADTLKFGAAPAWVTPQVIPEASDKTKDRPLVLLLHDQQTMLEAGKTTTYAEAAIKIQKTRGPFGRKCLGRLGSGIGLDHRQ